MWLIRAVAVRPRNAKNGCAPDVTAGEVLLFRVYLGLRKRAKKRKKGEGVSWTRLRRRSDEGDDDDEDDEEEEEEEERKEEKDDFPEATTTRAFVRFV